MTMTDRAIEELKRAGLFDKETMYGGMIGEAVKELLLVFQKQGHTGYSAEVVAQLFRKLVAGDVLSPLTDAPEEWMERSEGLMQSNRCPYVFRLPGQDPYSIVGRAFSDDGGKTYYTSIDSRVYFKLPGYPPQTEKVILK